MPFTFAHPTYAYPFKYINPRWFSVTGLVLGSMAPDFEYFLVLEPHQTIGHSPWGLIVQAIPLCILMASLFHLIVKEPLVLHLPSFFQIDRRAYRLLSSWSLKTVRDWTVFIVSVTAGFLSHVAVDAFTHENGYMVRHLPVLRTIVILDVPMYKLLQYSLSMLGMTAIVCAIGVALYKAAPDPKGIPLVTYRQKRYYWGFAAMAAVCTAGCKLLLSSSGNMLGILVVAPITGFCAGILLASLFWRNVSQ